MKPELIIAGLLSTYAAAATASPSTRPNTSICNLFENQKRANLIANYSVNLSNGSSLCAKILKTDDQNMFELVLFKRDSSGNMMKFGDNVGDEVRLFLLYNPRDSWENRKAFIGLTCNSSQGCETGESFIAAIEDGGSALYLNAGKYGKQHLSFLPDELVQGIALERN